MMMRWWWMEEYGGGGALPSGHQINTTHTQHTQHRDSAHRHGQATRRKAFERLVPAFGLRSSYVMLRSSIPPPLLPRPHKRWSSSCPSSSSLPRPLTLQTATPAGTVLFECSRKSARAGEAVVVLLSSQQHFFPPHNPLRLPHHHPPLLRSRPSGFLTSSSLYTHPTHSITGGRSSRLCVSP